MALAPLNLKQQQPRYQNELSSGGGSQQIVSRATEHKSAAKATLSSSLSGNVFFKGANRGFTQIRYMSGRNAAIGLNYHRAAGQQFRYIDERPRVVQQQAVVEAPKPSWGQQVGEIFTGLAGLAMATGTVVQSLGDAGLIHGNVKSQGASSKTGGNRLDNALNQLGGSGGGGAGALTSTGLPTASSFGANFMTSYNSIESQLKSGKFDPSAIQSSVTTLVNSARNDLSIASSLQSTLEKTYSKFLDEKTNIEQTKMKEANDKLTTANANEKSAKNDVNKAQEKMDVYSKNVAENNEISAEAKQKYQEANTKVKGCETKKATCQTNVTTLKGSLGAAKAKLEVMEKQRAAAGADMTAQAQLDAAVAEAQKEVDRINTELKQAQDDLAAADDALDNANTELEQANANLYKSAEAKEKAIKEFSEIKQDLLAKQQKYDEAIKTKAEANQNLEKIKSEYKEYGEMKNEADKYKEKIATLADNVEKAQKLQQSVNKAIEKYNKKHPNGTAPDVKMADVSNQMNNLTTLNNEKSKASFEDLHMKTTDMKQLNVNGTFNDTALKGAGIAELLRMRAMAEETDSPALAKINNAISNTMPDGMFAMINGTTDPNALTQLLSRPDIQNNPNAIALINAKLDIS